MTIASVRFQNFKALSQFTLQVRKLNVLVGPNNAGKSTVLDAFRLLSGAYKLAARRRATYLSDGEGGLEAGWGWLIPESAFPIGIENIHTDYNDEPTILSFRLEGGNKLVLYFGRSGPARLLMGNDGFLAKDTKSFQRTYPADIAVIPTLGPVERDENIVDPEVLRRWVGSHRASRYFRNFWFQNLEGFDEFAAIVEKTWPGVTVTSPERADLLSQRLNMFCRESRVDREIAWAGFGFQIWLQLLTHLSRARSADVLVVDEPEIYLHPDLQRHILGLLRSHSAKVVLATHSVEIVNEAEPAEVALVERGRQAARRLADIEGLQFAATALGSAQNMMLSRLARSKKVLFVEGKDRIVLTKLSQKMGMDVLAGGQMTVVPLGGFTEYERVAHSQWAFVQVLGHEIKVAVLLDRDYRNVVEVAQIHKQLEGKTALCLILGRKEIENYLLVPRALAAAISARLGVRSDKGAIDSIPEFDINALLLESTDPLKHDVYAQLLSRQLRHKSDRSVDDATVLLSAA